MTQTARNPHELPSTKEMLEHMMEHYEATTSWEQKFLDNLEEQFYRGHDAEPHQFITLLNLVERFPMEDYHV